MSTGDSLSIEPVSAVGDDHELSRRARTYGERVIRGGEWPLDGVDCSKLTWATSTRAKRRHGRCSYDGDGRATITLTEHTYDRAGFDACKKTIRHELVHAWQYQHQGERAVVTDSGVDLRADGAAVATSHSHDAHTETAPATGGTSTAAGTTPDPAGFTIETGHGDSFRAWVDLLELPGRCSTYYEREKADFAYVYGCPNCDSWWGKHRLCKSVRQAAHGGEGSTGYRYCIDCEVLLHLQQGAWYLDHGDHDDEAIRAFVAGDFESVVDSALPLVHGDDIDSTERPK